MKGKEITADELKKIVGDFRRNHKKLISNYIPNASLYSKMEREGKMRLYEYPRCLLIALDKGFMSEVIFLAKDSDALWYSVSLARRYTGNTIVIERVYREGNEEPIGHPRKLLKRMSRTDITSVPVIEDESVVLAKKEDIETIERIFERHFDPFTERIPDREEWSRLIEAAGIRIIRSGKEIGGLTVFEKQGGNLHLRYWWVNPDARNQGIGSRLLRAYFKEGENCRRQFLWVFDDNEDAIAKYRHYGFEFDGIADEIYVI